MSTARYFSKKSSALGRFLKVDDKHRIDDVQEKLTHLTRGVLFYNCWKEKKSINTNEEKDKHKAYERMQAGFGSLASCSNR
jgi:hypothetical protein